MMQYFCSNLKYKKSPIKLNIEKLNVFQYIVIETQLFHLLEPVSPPQCSIYSVVPLFISCTSLLYSKVVFIMCGAAGFRCRTGAQLISGVDKAKKSMAVRGETGGWFVWSDCNLIMSGCC